MLLLTACVPAFAQVTDSYCDSMGHFTIQNINLKGGNFTEGQELQSINIPVSYTCYTFPKTFGPEYRATLQINQNFRTVMNTLSGAGLGVDVTIQESGQAPVSFPWSDIKRAINSGSSVTKGFGRWLNFKPFPPVPAVYPLTGTMTLRIFVEAKFNSTFANINVPSVSAFNIMAYDPTSIGAISGKPVTTSSFNLRFIPDNSGRVIVSPSVINLGHFYTTYEPSLSKETAFTVTAQQNIGSGHNFTAPLAIAFKTNGLTLADADRAVILHNTDGQPNGLKLMVSDETGTPVTFNKTAPLGDINITPGATGRIVKQYTATVKAIPGETVKTGNFATAMTVVVTYI
ncbi:fimbrial protein [Salmonella enterica]|uniref:Fimbrial protein n=1 Tax=Salmonella newport TaxID=108619 RepID=A0A752CD19_SALNE|nr:fimbrial protein [Salmonella enterica]EKQ9811897.1 adhesion protein [Salmonella enterica subsp. enterica serovar Newport]ECO9821911.1 fimbrial protein [Salmonella enterica]EGW7195863.1 fimbrial protein [Salmonella enterica]EIW2890278.1 adhesion protein [Salmonella enterica]